MVNKKCLLLAGLCSMMMAAQPVLAQESESSSSKWGSRDMTYRGQGYDVLDSSFVPASRMKQHRKYIAHQYAFPPRPRNMWEIGVGIGAYNAAADVHTLMFWQKGGYGFNAHVRKSWGYLISTRLQYIYGIAKGLDYNLVGPSFYSKYPSYTGYYQAAGKPTVWGGANYLTQPAGKEYVVRNYRTEAHQLNMDFMFSINNVNFHKAKSNISFYSYLGFGLVAYATRTNALDANGNPYDFATIVGSTAQIQNNQGTIRQKLQDAMDNSYETYANGAYISDRVTLFDDNKIITPVVSLGAGAQFRLNKRVNLQVEDRLSLMAGSDLFDGATYNEVALTNTNDVLNYFSFGANFNLGNPRKKVEPLYWLNPLDHIYNELSYPRHMMLPEPIISDADGDGIADQFDKCPGTPAGVAVDSHGCPMDTDGDGVPDDRDKQLITPTECQPVDADGVGKCPCPPGCGTVAPAGNACGNIMAGSVSFDNNSSKVRPAAQAQLATLAAQMQAQPTCKVVVMGSGNDSKAKQQRSWDRVNAIIEYMSEKHGIDRGRFIFQYGQAGDANSVMYRSAMNGEEGPSNVAPPFPNLRK